MVNGWKKAQDRKIGNNISIIYVKKNLSLELFRDSMWGDTDNMNVIVRDKNQSSYESALGKSIEVERASTRREAMNFAMKYMRTH